MKILIIISSLLVIISCGREFKGCSSLKNQELEYLCENHQDLFFNYVFKYRSTPIVKANEENCDSYELAFYYNSKIFLCQEFFKLTFLERVQTILHEFRHADLEGWKIRTFDRNYFVILDQNTINYFSNFGFFNGYFYTNTLKIPHFPHSQCKTGFFKGRFACDPVAEEDNHGSYSMDVIFLLKVKNCDEAFIYLTERFEKNIDFLKNKWHEICL